MKKNAYDSQKTFGIAEQERADRNKVLGTTEGMIGPASASLARFYSPGGMSEYKKGLLNQKEASATGAFNNAQAATRQRALSSGFGYAQPIEQAGESNVDIARARRMSEIPGEAESESIDKQFGAIGLQNALANTELGVAKTYNPLGYYGIGAGQAEEEARRRGGLWKGLAKIGLTAAAPFTGGATLPIAGAF